MLAPARRTGFHPAQPSFGVIAQEASTASASGKVRILIKGMVDPFAGLDGGEGAAEGSSLGLEATGPAALEPDREQGKGRSDKRAEGATNAASEGGANHSRRPGGVVVTSRIQIMTRVTARE